VVSAELPTMPLSPPLPPPENKLFYPAVDGLRAVAVLLVFVHHFPSGLPVSFGWTGVDIFFVLSGFLITGILYDTREDGHRFRNFYARRALRIFPLFYGVFVLLALAEPMMHWNWGHSWLLSVSYLGGLPAQLGLTSLVPPGSVISQTTGAQVEVGHFWSLYTEEQFYLLWPMLVFAVKDRVRLRNLCFVGVATVVAVRVALLLHDPARYLGTSVLYYGLPFRADGLLLGAAVALMLRGPEAQGLKRAGPRLFAGGLAAAGAACLVSGLVLHQGFSWALEMPWMSSFGYTLIDVAAAGALLMVIQPGTLLFSWLSVRPLRKLGQVSYGFYVFHQIPRWLYFGLAHRLIGRYTSHTGPLEGLIAFVCTYALARLSFRYFETPFLRLKDRFTVEEKRLPSYAAAAGCSELLSK
jgi:peptidoglycan/LPS O-acetylase OafA/YrhL